MTEKKLVTQIGIKISGKVAESLLRMSEESGQPATTVAKTLLFAAIRQAEEGQSKPLPPYLRRFYGETDDLQEEDE